jgi:6-phosphogluconolactonase
MAQTKTVTTNWTVFSDAQQVAEAAAHTVLRAAEEAVSARNRFRLVLAGGRTPIAAYRLLAAAAAQWDRWEVFFGDERCLPAADPQRNSKAAFDAWLGRVPIPAVNVSVIPAELGAEAAAAAYTRVVETALPFDLVLLGMGEDGHTASLFPGHEIAVGGPVLPVHDAPKPPSDRVSLSLDALSDAHRVLILATGDGKRAAVRRWRGGASLPVARVRARRELLVYLDREAAPEHSGAWRPLEPEPGSTYDGG